MWRAYGSAAESHDLCWDTGYRLWRGRSVHKFFQAKPDVNDPSRHPPTFFPSLDIRPNRLPDVHGTITLGTYPLDRT